MKKRDLCCRFGFFLTVESHAASSIFRYRLDINRNTIFEHHFSLHIKVLVFFFFFLKNAGVSCCAKHCFVPTALLAD